MTQRLFPRRRHTRQSLAPIAFCLVVVLVAGVRASTQRNLATIPSSDIDAQLKSFAPSDGFTVNLFASEPDISKPIHMNFDAAGRLWVAGSSLYPQIRPGAQPIDKVFIVEDTDGDGKADTSTVFADNLLIPTGLVPDDTVPHLAAYVANSSELLYLEDTDGDGKADRSTVVLSGFGTEDTHHLIHTFRWGPDGHLYFTQSIYIHSHVETPWGVQRLLGGGVWRYHPKTQKLEVFTRGGINMWGHHFDRYGQSFLTDGAGALGINYAFPGATYETAVGAERVLRGLNPGQPKHSGLEVASGRHLPDDWQDRFITADFRGNRINTFRLEDSASGYISTQADDLLASTHSAFRPVDVKMGPDGAIYIADWYNPIIQHGEVDFRDPRRDLERGRIWRVASDRPRVVMPDLERAGVDQLLAALEAPELYTRERARPLLARHGADAVLPALGRWVAAVDTNAPGHAERLLEALWVHQWLDTRDPALLQAALASPDFHVRAGAVRVASDWADHLDDSLALLTRAAADANARVRLEAVNALRRLGTAEAARAALGVTDQPLDTNLDFAVWLTMRDLAEAWLPKVTADPAFFGTDPARLILALRAANRPDALGPLVQLWQAGNIPDALRVDAAQLMAQTGGPTELRLLFDLARGQASAADRVAIFDALARAATERKARPAGSLASLVEIADGADTEVRAAALRLAGAWQLADARPAIVSAARSDASALRTAGLQALADLGPSSQSILEEIATSGVPAHRADAIGALARLDVAAAAAIAAGLLASPEGTDAAAIAGAFLTREAGPAALTASLAGRSIAPATGRAVLRAAASSGRNVPDLVRAVESAAGLDALATMPAGEALRALIETVRTDGDAVRGERVYHRRELACTTCHAIAGAGGRVGPDLVSIGASAPLDYIVQALLDPQATVKEGFQVTTLTRIDGSIAAGILLLESGNEVVLRDAANVEHRVPMSQVASREISPVSLMPPGLTSALREDELVDLLAFLSQLGREGGVTVPNVPYVRRYELLEGGNAPSALLRSTSMGAAARREMPGLTWHPVYARVDGSLPTSEIPVGTSTIAYFGDQRFRVARFELDVARAGDVALAFDDPAGLTVYVAGERFAEAQPVTTLTLPAGRHTITVVLDLRVRGTDTALRVRLADAGANAAQVQAVGGG